MALIKKALWAVDALLVAALAFAVLRMLPSGAADKTPGGSAGTQPAVVAPAASEGISGDEAQEITKSGAIVPGVSVHPPSVQQNTTQTPIEVATNFDYKLIGTILHPNAAFAVFSGPGGAQTVEGIGNKIGDATVVSVDGSGAILERGGQVFKVKLEERKLPQSPAQLAQASPAVPLDNQGPQVAMAAPGLEPGQTPAEQVGADEEGNQTSDQTEEDPDQMIIPLETYKEYLQNMGKYTSQLEIMMHYDEEKKVDGLILTKVPTTSEAYKRGLRQGDIVQSIQDVPITDASVVGNVGWKILQDEDYIVSVVIIRNGEEDILTYEIWPE
jgi:type II secretory pathway component PulC